MVDIMKIIISNQKAEVEVFDTIYSNNIKQYRAKFVFTDNSWDDLDKIVVFDRVKNYDTPIGISINKENSSLVEIIDDKTFYCIIPWEIMTQAGYFNISIFGTGINDNKEVIKKSLQINERFTVQDSGDVTVRPRIPTPNIYEQLLNRLNEINEKIEKAEGGVGRTTPEGGEIFNDYENNKALAPYTSVKGYENTAGGRAFKVLNASRENKIIEEVLINNASIVNEYDVEFDNASLEEDTSYRLILKGSIYNHKYSSNINEDIISTPRWSTDLDPDFTILLLPEIYYEIGDPKNDFNNSSSGTIFITNNLQNNINFSLHSGNDSSLGFDLNLSISKISTSDVFLINIYDISGIEIGDKISIYSIATNKVYSDCGIVININNNTITVGGLSKEILSLTSNDITYVYFSNKLELNGDIILGTGASSEGGPVVDDNDGKTYYNKSLGARAHVEGSGNLSLNYDTHVEGSINIASGNQAHAGGYRTKSTGYQTFTMGNGTEAGGHQALATGSSTKATGQQSSSFGSNTEATGHQSSAKGSGTKATGGQSSAKGYKTEATGEQSDSSGHSTQASAGRAHAGGLYSNAKHVQSFVHGTRLETGADNQFVTGIYNQVVKDALFVVGNGNPEPGKTSWSDPQGIRRNAFVVNIDGTALVQSTDINKYNAIVHSGLLKSYVDTFYNTKIVPYINTFYNTKIAPGLVGKKSGSGVILNNDNNKVGQFSVATGYLTKAVGEHSLTIGHSTETNGARSFAGGLYSFANGSQSFVHGTRLITNIANQFVIGKFNEEDSGAAFVIGWGSGDTWNGTTRNGKNIFTVQTDGTTLIGNTKLNIDNAVVTSKLLKEYVAANGGKSPWDSQSEMLFSTGALKILNHVPTSGQENDYDYGIYLDNNYSENAEFTSQRLLLDSRGHASSASLTNTGLAIISRHSIPYISLKKTDDNGHFTASLEINNDGITYNSKSITWDRLFAAIEKIESAVDVSIEGQ